MKAMYIALISLPLMVACQTTGQQADNQVNNKNITIGLVQSQIKKGISSAEVIEVLGSPNIVSTNKEGLEVWVYDKFSSESSSSHIGTGIIPSLLVDGKSSSSSNSQSTMTVIIKFDEQHLVDNVAYHRSKF